MSPIYDGPEKTRIVEKKEIVKKLFENIQKNPRLDQAFLEWGRGPSIVEPIESYPEKNALRMFYEYNVLIIKF